MVDGVRTLLLGQLRMEQMLEQLLQAKRAVADDLQQSPLCLGTSASTSTASVLAWTMAEKKDAACQVDDLMKKTTGEYDNDWATRSRDSMDALASVGSMMATRESQYSGSPHMPAWFQNLRMRSEIWGNERELADELGKPSLRQSQSADLRAALSCNVSGVYGGLRWLPLLTPSSKMRLCFDVVSLVVLVYDMVSVPYFVAFDSSHDAFTWLSYLSIAYWVADMLANFRTGFYSKGELEMRPAIIAWNYLTGAFLVDLSVVAVDVIAIALKILERSGSESDSVKLMRIFKISRLIRLTGVLRLRRLRTVVERSNAQYFLALLPTFFFLLETFIFVIVFMWLNHLLACLWCFLARHGQSDTGLTWLDLTMGDRAYSSYGDGYEYTTALHWAITQMTPGSMQVFPQNSAERAFNIACLVAGLVVFSTLISAISARVTSFKIQMQSHRSKMDALTTLLERSGVSSGLRLSICKQADARLRETRPCTVGDLDAVSKLSLSLRSALQLELCDPYLLEHPFLIFVSEVDEALWKAVCNSCVRFSMLVQKDTLFINGAQAHAMHFITMGKISYTVDREFEYFSEDGICPEVVEPGQSLSEAALWCDWRHVGCAEVTAARHCEVLSLVSEKFLAILNSDPLMAQMAWSYAHSFFTFLTDLKPSIHGFPNDLHVHFGVDEVIASMPKDATICCSQVAIRLLKQPQGAIFASWIQTVKDDKTEQLIDEVKQGGSTLLATKQGVVRCVPLVVLRLTRADGRMLVRLRLIKKADGSPEATCKLPACKQESGEHPCDCLQRLLHEKLKPISQGLVVHGVEKRSETEASRQFGVPTRYVRTVISASWQENANSKLSELLVEEAQRLMPKPSATLSSRAAGASARCAWVEAEVYSFPGGDVYAWITPEEHSHLTSQHGQRLLSRWLCFLGMGDGLLTGVQSQGPVAVVG